MGAMTSDILRAVIFGITIVALIAQFAYDWVQSREKKRENVKLQTTVDRLITTVDRIDSGLNQLVAQGKITKEDAQRVLNIKLEETLHLQGDLKTEVIRDQK